MKTMKKLPSEPEKAFNKGWGRSLACTIHWLREHYKQYFDPTAEAILIDYMENNRIRQLRTPNQTQQSKERKN